LAATRAFFTFTRLLGRVPWFASSVASWFASSTISKWLASDIVSSVTSLAKIPSKFDRHFRGFASIGFVIVTWLTGSVAAWCSSCALSERLTSSVSISITSASSTTTAPAKITSKLNWGLSRCGFTSNRRFVIVARFACRIVISTSSVRFIRAITWFASSILTWLTGNTICKRFARDVSTTTSAASKRTAGFSLQFGSFSVLGVFTTVFRFSFFSFFHQCFNRRCDFFIAFYEIVVKPERTFQS